MSNDNNNESNTVIFDEALDHPAWYNNPEMLKEPARWGIYGRGPLNRWAYDVLNQQWYCWVDDRFIVEHKITIPVSMEDAMAAMNEIDGGGHPNSNVTYFGDLSDEEREAWLLEEHALLIKHIKANAPKNKTNDVYPEGDEPINCSGKHGPHDLRIYGQKQMANGRLTCRECYRITKRNQKSKRRGEANLTREQIDQLAAKSKQLKDFIWYRSQKLIKLRDDGLTGDHDYAVMSQAEFDKRVEDLADKRTEITRLDEKIAIAEEALEARGQA